MEPEVEPQSETEPEAEPDLNQEGLIITEILPNPDGVDVGNEFIEIYNPNEHEVDLSGYKILVGLNSEKSYSFPAATNVGPLAYLVIYNSEVGFTLVNSTSQVKLQLGEYYNQTDQYENPPAGQAWALIDGVWAYTNRPTPGASNLGFEESLVVSNLKPCADNQYRHPETNRCRLIVSSSSGPTPCRADQERNPETNRCRKIASSSSLTPCKEGQYRSPETNRCRAVLAAQSELKPCAENQYRHPETNRCRKIIEMSDAPHAVEPTKKQTGDTLGFWVLGGIGALAAGYALWEWRGSIFRIFARR